MKKWPLVYWIVAAAILVLFGSILSIIFVHYKAAKVTTHYAIWTVILVLFFYIKSRGCAYVHIHHYTIMMILLSYTCYQDVFTTFISGFFNGIMIEGASFWGYDPIFIKADPKENDERSKKLR